MLADSSYPVLLCLALSDVLMFEENGPFVAEKLLCPAWSTIASVHLCGDRQQNFAELKDEQRGCKSLPVAALQFSNSRRPANDAEDSNHWS